jgi:hypothetical protein
MKAPVNLTPLQKDYAVYLPAISSFYSTYVAKQRLEEFVPTDRIPDGFDRGIEGMNFKSRARVLYLQIRFVFSRSRTT